MALIKDNKKYVTLFEVMKIESLYPECRSFGLPVKYFNIFETISAI